MNHLQVEKHVTFYFSKHYIAHDYSLVDRRDNGGVSGRYERVVYKCTSRSVSVRGVDNYEILSIPVATAVGATSATTSETIVTLNQHACHGKVKPTHSSVQVETHKNEDDDKSIKVGGH